MDISSVVAVLPARYVVFVFAALGVCAIADALMPQPPAGSDWVPARRLLHVLASNYLNARNAVPAGAVPASVAVHAAEVRRAAEAVEQTAGTLATAAEGTPEAQTGVVASTTTILKGPMG